MSTLKGVDVSEHNGTLDWAALKKSGVQFAVIRAGIGVHASTGMREDKQFRANVKGCESAGIPYGLYFFCYSLNTTEVQKECAYMKSLISSACTKKPFMVSYDFEDDTITKGKNAGITLGASAFNTFTAAWNKYFTALGYKTPVYINLSMYKTWYDTSKLGSYPLWPAYYQSKCFTDSYAIWQYGYATYLGKTFDGDYSTSDFVNGTTSTKTTTSTASTAYTFKNKASETICYADTTKKIQTGSLNENEECNYLGKVGSMYAVSYKVDGATSYKVGLVEYNGVKS